MNTQNPNNNIENALDKEWLCTNNIGAYASSSISGANTRRYHGLLIASFSPPGERKVVVSRIEEEVTFGDERFELGCSAYPGNIISPNGLQYLQEFENKPYPVFTYGHGRWQLRKRIALAPDANTCVVQYENLSKEVIQLKLAPYLVYRDYHRLFFEDNWFDFYSEAIDIQSIKIYPHYQAHPLFFHYTKGDFSYERVWYKNHFYQEEADRGFDFLEDSYAFGAVNLSMGAGESACLVFSTDENFQLTNAEKIFEASEQKFQTVAAPYDADETLKDLVASAEAFMVTRHSSRSLTLLAGYHWFLDWGRDTLIALRGIGISTGRQALCKSILATFLNYLDKGMLPNRFPDEGEQPAYNSVDAALWLFVVLYEYHQAFNDHEFIKQHLTALGEILYYYAHGTRFGIRLNKHGFIQAGEGNSNLTWMDAKVNGEPVTPRHGCPVEINMLWYNAIKIYDAFLQKYENGISALEWALLLEESGYFAGSPAGTSIETWISLFEQNFVSWFYNDDGYLNDVVAPDNAANNDASIRPNQVYALSLPFTLLNEQQAASVLECVRTHLLTDYGLRSLSPVDPNFVPLYAGSPDKRDAAYHQGTVWAFLIEEYYTAYLKHHEYSEDAKKEVRTALQPLFHHFYHDGCVGGVAEIFDGLRPLHGKGCVHQAWSVAALISLLIKVRDQQPVT